MPAPSADLVDARRRLGEAAPIDARGLGAPVGRTDPIGPIGAPSAPHDLDSLRVLHVIGGLGPGGAERQLVHTVSGMLARGVGACEVVVTDDCGAPDGAYRQRLRACGVEPVRAGAGLDPRAVARFAAEPALRRAAMAIPDALRPRCTELFGEIVARRPHVVHCWLDHTNIWGGVAAALAGVPGIVLAARSVAPIRFPPLLEPWMAPWYQALLDRPGVLLCNNSRPGADDYAGWLSVPRHRITVILNGVDLEAMPAADEAAVAAFRREVGAAAGEPLLVGIFRIGEEKRPEIFVRVAQALLGRVPGLRVVVVGTGPLQPAMQALVRSGPHVDRFLMLGRRHDVSAILGAASLLLLTSRAEGTPNVLLEAQHLGCPVVTTAAGGAVDAVLDGTTGFIRPIDDVEALIEACLQVLVDRSLHAAMSRAAPSFVAERFGLGRMVEETLAAHRRALEAGLEAAPGVGS